MKKIYDPTVSKKPMMVPDDADLAKMVSTIARFNEEIDKLDDKIETLCTSTTYLNVVLQSRQKMTDIAYAAMFLPASDSNAISRAQAQFLERKLITEELSKLEADKKDKVSFVEKLKKALNTLSEKVNKFRESRNK